MVVIVEVEEDGGAAGIAFKGIELPIHVILHEVKAQLPARVGLLAEVLYPVPNLLHGQHSPIKFLLVMQHANISHCLWRKVDVKVGPR